MSSGRFEDLFSLEPGNEREILGKTFQSLFRSHSTFELQIAVPPVLCRTHSDSNAQTPLKMPQAQPELKKYLDKRVEVQLNGSRKVMGTLRGYDVFLNIVLDEATESKPNGEKVRLGMCVIRGNSVVMMEALDRIDDHRGGR